MEKRGLSLSLLEEKKTSLIVTSSKSLGKTTNKVLKHIVNKKNGACVYVTVAKSFARKIASLEKQGIKKDNIFFIDITPFPKSSSQKDNHLPISPHSLTNLSLAISKALSLFPPGKRVLIIDNLSAFGLYHGPALIGKFLHSMSVKMRKKKVKLIFFLVKEESNEKQISQYGQFCDITFKVT